MNTKAIFVILGLIGMSTSAVADGPPRGRAYAPAFSWNGCYLGGFVGGAWGGDARSRDLDGYNALNDTWSYSVDNSVIAGGTAGCNIQSGSVVFGIEGELGHMNLSGSAFDPLSPFIPLDTRSSTTIGDFYGVVAGRIGVAVDKTLIYAKGGLVFADTDVSTIDANPAGGNTITTSRSHWETGLAIGGGIEHALSSNWSVKAEYLFLGLGSDGTTCGNATVGGGRFCWSHDNDDVHSVKLGLNYRFGHERAPLPLK